jgi:hypothetical protein
VVILLAENHHSGTGGCRCLINGAETWLHSSSVGCQQGSRDERTISEIKKTTRIFYNTYVTVTSPVGVSRLAVGICVHHSTLRKLAGRAIVRCSACSLGDTSSPSSSSVSTRLRSAVSPAVSLQMCSARPAPHTSRSTTNRVMACELQVTAVDATNRQALDHESAVCCEPYGWVPAV